MCTRRVVNVRDVRAVLSRLGDICSILRGVWAVSNRFVRPIFFSPVSTHAGELFVSCYQPTL